MKQAGFTRAARLTGSAGFTRAARLPGSAGFTLIELMIGLLIFGLMASAGTALLAGSVEASSQARSLADDAGSLTRLNTLLAADCLQAAPRPWRDQQGQRHSAFSTGEGALFTLVRRGWTNQADAPRASLQRVSWALEGDRLVRRGAAMVDGTDAGPDAVFLAGVSSVTLRIHDGRDWRDSWASRDVTALPRAIELTLQGPKIGTLRQVLLMGPGAP
jgi:general secretion pathway protein J